MTKILITGAAGFIGSHLTEMCIEQGFEVKAFIRYNSRNNWGWLEQSPYRNQIEIVTGDVRDYDSVAGAMKQCHAVFHLGALIGIPYSYVSPLAYIKTNIEGTYNILQSAREHGLENVLITSTSETYGTAQYVPIDEGHPSVGQSPYSASKIGADALAISYYRSFGLPVKIVRPFNTYGPRQSARAIIPTIISQLLAEKPTLALGNLAPTRDLSYVKDTCRGFLEIYRSDELVGKATNIGMNKEITIGALVELIADLAGKKANVDIDAQRVRPGASEVERLRCDNTRLLEKTQWKPQYSLKDGLRETIEFIRHNADLYKPELYHV